MTFCTECETQLNEECKYCQNCGSHSKYNTNNVSDKGSFNSTHTTYKKTPTQILVRREEISAIIWCVIACIQGLTGLSVLGGLIWLGDLLGLDLSWSSLFTLGLAAFNGYGAYRSFKLAEKVRLRQRGIVAEYDNILTHSIVAIVVNVLLGSVIGIAGAVFDLFNRNYALSNAELLED